VLESLLSTLVRKPANGKDNYKNDFFYKYLLKEDRRLLRRGELTTPGATTLWMKSYIKKHVILLSDVLIITVPHVLHKVQCYVVEHIIDLQACKLRSNGQVFGGTLEGAAAQPPPPSAKDKAQAADKQLLECAFQVIWPGGSLQLFADSKESKEVWVLNLFLAICSRVGGESNGQGQVLGWRHQYMLGTMHSAVLSHDEAHVRELVAQCDAGQMEFSACIDASDEDGYTPLHYACIMRMHGIIRALHEAAADVTAPDHRGLTPLHWAAMQLDDYTLSLLCSHVFDLDICDKQQRTPLYMACVEGRDVGGHTDNAALKKCVACMLTHQPNVNFYDQYGYTMIHYLAASWQYEALELLLQADAEANARVGKSGMTALHLACLAQPIKLAEGEAKRIIQGSDATASSTSAKERNVPSPTGGAEAGAASVYEKLNHPMGSTTLRTLLKAGARPNAKDSRGRTALHILAEPGRDDLWDLMELTDGVAVLLSFGARFDDSAALQGLKSRLLGVSVEALVERWSSLPVINGDALNLT
jgi:ankyrin repeat protein